MDNNNHSVTSVVEYSSLSSTLTNQENFEVKQVEKYVITKQIGFGKQGCTFQSYHIDNKDKLLCAKRIDRELIEQDQHTRELFQREAQIIRKLKHPNIVQILDVVKSKNWFYIITEYCNGGTLEELIHRRRHGIVLNDAEAYHIIK